MTDAEKLEAIKQYFASIDLKEEEHPDDVYGWSGGNIDDAYSLGYEYAESNVAKDILDLIGDE